MRTRGIISDFYLLSTWGVLSLDELREAEFHSNKRGLDLEGILITEYNVPKHLALRALSEHYNVPGIEYDERLPIPPGILAGLDPDVLLDGLWVPLMKDVHGTILIAARHPDRPETREEVSRTLKGDDYEFRVALADDIRWYIQDFLHAEPGGLIGTERTGLAFWRNTMAHWRTRLAGYRTDLAKARTALAFQRWGLGTLALANSLLQTRDAAESPYYYLIFLAGAAIFLYGLPGYLKIRKSRMSPPSHQTLVEVTAATIHFLEDYHFIEGSGVWRPTKGTMLARMGDLLSDHCTILFPSPSSRVRTQLARERNVLAAQRTIAACYRTIYSRARTGLAFMRTGFSFMSIGAGLVGYFGLGLLTYFDLFLILAGTLMFIDGMRWYLPVRKEQAEIPTEIPRSVSYPD